jgi:hypothetical protein
MANYRRDAAGYVSAGASAADVRISNGIFHHGDTEPRRKPFIGFDFLHVSVTPW